MDKKNDNKKFMVVAIRHFSNGEHHWLAPEGAMPYGDDPVAFGAEGVNAYGKPWFNTVKEAEDYAMSLRHGEWALAQWEERRPTFVVVEDCVFCAVMERDNYPWPDDCEEWNDAKAADFERECDIDEFLRNAVWDSDTDEEYVSKAEVEKIKKVVSELKPLEAQELFAWREGEHLAVYKESKGKKSIVKAIESVKGFPREKLEVVEVDEPENTVHYKVK